MASSNHSNGTGNGHKSSPQPLHIFIVGAGIGGLTAALALRRQGHKTTVFEQSRLANEIGAAINIAPNCNGILRRLGLFLENHGAVDCKAFNMYDKDGNIQIRLDRSDDEKTHGHPYHLMHRAHLHRAIKDLAIGEEGKGTPTNLHTASRIIDVDPETATVHLESGESFTGDAIIGADGIHSKTRVRLPASAAIPEPFGSGMSGFRFLVPAASLAANPITAPFVSSPGILSRFVAVSDLQTLITYPCQNNEVMNCMLSMPTKTLGAPKSQGWGNSSSKAHMLSVTSPAFAPVPRAILDLASEDGVRLWELMDMDDLETWVTARMAVLGDAAHPFTPWRGQGGAMAIEDACSLAAVLPLGTQPEQIHERLVLYERCRRGRALKIQDLSRRASPLSEEALKAEASGGSQRDFAPEMLGFDEWRHSKEALAEMMAGEGAAA